jgi:hypothetical protein
LQPIDSKREEFRKYLERAGVMDALTKVLVSLYEEAEKPDDALKYPFLVCICVILVWYRYIALHIVMQ